MINIESNGSRFYGQAPATIDELVHALNRHPLNVLMFDRFVWREGGARVRFHGNFLTISHVFSITTDEPEVIATLRGAIRANLERQGIADADERSTPTTIARCDVRFYHEARVTVTVREESGDLLLFPNTYIHGSGGVARPAARAVKLAERRADTGDALHVYVKDTADGHEWRTFPAAACTVRPMAAK